MDQKPDVSIEITCKSNVIKDISQVKIGEFFISNRALYIKILSLKEPCAIEINTGKEWYWWSGQDVEVVDVEIKDLGEFNLRKGGILP